MRKIRLKADAAYSKVLVFDSEFDGPWTLNECRLSPPQRQTNIIEIPGRDGAVDLAPALGDIKYQPREFYAALECSEGTRDSRQELIERVINKLEGRYCQIFLPDDPMHYIEGYVDVEVEYNDINHARIILTSQVYPWRIRVDETDIVVAASASPQTLIIKNRGGRKVIPTISSWTYDGVTQPNITLTCGEWFEYTFTGYDVIYPEELAMSFEDELELTYSGTGCLEFRWKEASL